MVVPGFLLTEPPPKGTQDAQLLVPLATRLIYSQEPLIPSDNEKRESTPKPIHPEVAKKDFEVIYLEDAPGTSIVRSSGEMGFEEKTPDLLALLTAHVGGSSPTVTMPPRPATSVVTRIPPAEIVNKKRKCG